MTELIESLIVLLPFFIYLLSRPITAALTSALLLADAIYSVVTGSPIWWVVAILAFICALFVRPRQTHNPAR